MIGLIDQTGGNILPFFRADVEGRREYGLLKKPEPSAPNFYSNEPVLRENFH
jgi:hypothetical protein